MKEYFNRNSDKMRFLALLQLALGCIIMPGSLALIFAAGAGER